MKYFGFTYKGAQQNYQNENEVAYDTLHKALEAANREWDAQPDPYVRRLLVVIRKCETGDAPTSETAAFFQFTDSRLCAKFAADHGEITWTLPDADLKDINWNSNAQIMG